MTTEEIVRLAAHHVNRAFDGLHTEHTYSALTCLSDAQYALRHGNDAAARLRAIKSLAYSVGIYHEDYARAIE